MDAADKMRAEARAQALSLADRLLQEDARHRRHSRLELVLRDGRVDHLNYSRVIKIDTPESKAA